jgi:recombinational DNA repair ATPase RecF
MPTKTSPKILTLHNWRCFESAKFNLPSGNFLILDNNGIGKTSILTAYYSLLTGQPWPSTKFIHSIKLGQSWFGLSLEISSKKLLKNIQEESPCQGVAQSGGGTLTTLSGKISGPRTTTKYETDSKDKFQVLTYQPTDNYWLTNSRESRLTTLSEIISGYNPEYTSKVSKLNQIVKSKTSLIKYILDNDYQNPTPELLEQYNFQILELSLDIWACRLEFLTFWQKKLPEFCELINCTITNWKIELQLTNSTTSKTLIRNLETLNIKIIKETDMLENTVISNKLENTSKKSPCQRVAQSGGSTTLQQPFDFKIYLQNQLNLNNISWAAINNREIAAGRVLFGAQRDEFLIFADQIPLQNILSRGEMRLFVLWSKSLSSKIYSHCEEQKTTVIQSVAKNLIPTNNKTSTKIESKTKTTNQTKNTIWLLDDVFNELDGERELSLINTILHGSYQIIATGTKATSNVLDCYSIERLTLL